jgi:hypothetical protein
VSLRILAPGQRESLTLRGAYLEIAGDLLGSLAVLLAGLAIAATGWQQADAVASLVVAALIVPRTVLLLRDSVDVLLEATPKGVDLGHVEQHILEAPGVTGVHDPPRLDDHERDERRLGPRRARGATRSRRHPRPPRHLSCRTTSTSTTRPSSSETPRARPVGSRAEQAQH